MLQILPAKAYYLKNRKDVKEQHIEIFWNGVKSPAKLWCEHSMIKSTSFIEEITDISELQLKASLKCKYGGYKTKKSSVCAREQINYFLVEASNNIYLLMSTVTI